MEGRDAFGKDCSLHSRHSGQHDDFLEVNTADWVWIEPVVMPSSLCSLLVLLPLLTWVTFLNAGFILVLCSELDILPKAIFSLLFTQLNEANVPLLHCLSMFQRNIWETFIPRNLWTSTECWHNSAGTTYMYTSVMAGNGIQLFNVFWSHVTYWWECAFVFVLVVVIDLRLFFQWSVYHFLDDSPKLFYRLPVAGRGHHTDGSWVTGSSARKSWGVAHGLALWNHMKNKALFFTVGHIPIYCKYPSPLIMLFFLCISSYTLYCKASTSVAS